MPRGRIENSRAGKALEKVLGDERAARLDSLDAYAPIQEQVHETKRGLLEFLIGAKRAGKRIAAYGAAAKGNTLLNYCGVRDDFIDCVADRSPHKQGKFLPGTHIPIVHPDRDPRNASRLPADPALEPARRGHGAKCLHPRMGRPLRDPGSARLGPVMRFAATPIPGAWVIEPEEQADERGFFARVFCSEEFARHGLNPKLAQCSISFNKARGTLRGMHWQDKPHEEAKLVRCTQGAIFDVALDLRHGSPAYLKWHGVELTANNRRMLYIPEGCAHGFLSLADNTEVHYHISEFHHPECARGVRFDDPAFGIAWPESVRVISARDRGYSDFHSGKPTRNSS